MTSTRSPHLLLTALLCAAAAVSCKSPPPLQASVSLTLDCPLTGDDGRITDRIAVGAVNKCVYSRETRRLYFDLVKAGETGVQIAVSVDQFAGPGIYKAGNRNGDEGSGVHLTGDDHQCNGQSWVDQTDCGNGTPDYCTIEVTDTDLHEIEVSEETRGYVVVTAKCRALFAHCDGPGNLEETQVTPGSFTVSIPDCLATLR